MFDVFRKRVTLIRQGGEYNSDGYYETHLTLTKVISASVQNASYNEIMMLDEAYRSKEVLTIFTDEKLQLGENGTGRQADKIEIDDKKYQVIKIKQGRNLNWATAHSEAIIVSCDDDS
jgi:hypothetical protein